ncbi:hypothetical protein BDW02DRAFT_160407 [Decorospora gaudefroyi]|uniref:Uncharacterized protein n=1 Tax=Decorospora gaudefroyi TaxID=184978 RepID=A0A6A5KN03_9PLEO|nr:hypothetical protein BDW02DRAFT_160407 [Decorospora gaudefroyi]
MSSSKFSYKPLTLTPINFSLTDGTPIPAPLDSPPDTPRPPTPGRGPLSSHPTPKSPGSPARRESPPLSKTSEDSTAGAQLQQSRTSDAASTMSPTSPSAKRPASVRKFLGLRTLSSSDSLKSERPGSPATINSQAPSLSRRKSGSWFGKRKTFTVGSVPEGQVDATTYSNGRTVSHSALPTPAPKPQGPPPPALPGLSSFGVNEDTLSLGADDMFKNIGQSSEAKSDAPKSTRW